MIHKLLCIYLDLQKVSAEVGNIINVSRYGDILYKKQKLKQYHQQLYKAAGVNQFIYVNDPDFLPDIIEEIKLNKGCFVILHHSSFAVTRDDEFKLFIEKIRYLDTNLCISDYDSQKPFLILDSSLSMLALEKIYKNPKATDHILEHEISVTEKFKLEKFYTTIRTSVDFIEFLHTNFEARYFNSIEKDELYITKRSDNIKKIENEYHYYEFLPDELKLFFIKPIDLQKTNDWCSYKVEKLNVPDVSIQWVHNSFTPREFKILLAKLFLFLEKRPTKTVPEKDHQAVIEKFYLKKVADRIAELKAKPEYTVIADIIRNSTEIKDIDKLFELYKVKLASLLAKKKYEPMLALSHGDLCASNMLYDKRINMLKLIDPRGAETQEGLYFDAYYDVCKLSHSIMGDYDLINNGLFDLFYDNNLQIQLKADPLPDKAQYQKLFLKFLEDNQFDYELVRIFEASLFLSMLPLHIDNPKKVVAFILNAVQIIYAMPNK